MERSPVMEMGSKTKCSCRAKKSVSKPNPGGKEITSQKYMEDIEQYSSQKENCLTVPSSNNFCETTSPMPSTSGINVIRPESYTSDDSESDMETENSEVCCVCGCFYPPNTSARPYLKIIKWAQCDACGHWVHLAFCDKKNVLR